MSGGVQNSPGDALSWVGWATAIRLPNRFVTAGWEPFATLLGLPTRRYDRQGNVMPDSWVHSTALVPLDAAPQMQETLPAPSNTELEHRPAIASKLPASTMSSR